MRKINQEIKMHTKATIMKNHTLTKPLLIALITVLSFVAPCSAATLAFYDINSVGLVADGANATGLTASTLDASSADGVTVNFRWIGTHVPYWFPASINDGTDPAVGDILATFSLTPDAGQQIELGTTNVFDIGVLAYQVSGSYTATVRLFVASDAEFTTILATSTTITNNRESAGGATLTSSNAGSSNVGEYVGLLGLDNAVTSSSTLYFGIAMVENGTGDNARFDGVGVYGTVSPIPAPAGTVIIIK